MHASFVRSIKFIYMLPLLVQEITVPEGQPLVADCCCGVSSTLSSPQYISPHICCNPSQWPISCVAVLPLLKGAAVLIVPKADGRITTPSLSFGPPSGLEYPIIPPAIFPIQIFK